MFINIRNRCEQIILFNNNFTLYLLPMESCKATFALFNKVKSNSTELKGILKFIYISLLLCTLPKELALQGTSFLKTLLFSFAFFNQKAYLLLSKGIVNLEKDRFELS